jgi:hypothetical protein
MTTMLFLTILFILNAVQVHSTQCVYNTTETVDPNPFALGDWDFDFLEYLALNPDIQQSRPRDIGVAFHLDPGHDYNHNKVNLLAISMWQFIFHDIFEHVTTGVNMSTFSWDCSENNGTGPDPYCGKSLPFLPNDHMGFSNTVKVPYCDSADAPQNGVLKSLPLSRQLLNLGNIYGDLKEINVALRKFDGSGQLKTSSYTTCAYPPPPPFTTGCERIVTINDLLPNKVQTGIPVRNIFGWADIDLPTLTDFNVNVGLWLHYQYIVWVRNHNRLAQIIRDGENGSKLDDDTIYNIARTVNVALYEKVVIELVQKTMRPEHKFTLDDITPIKEDPKIDGTCAINPQIPSLLFSYAGRMLGHDGFAEWPIKDKYGNLVQVIPESLGETYPNIPLEHCIWCNVMGATPGPEQHIWGLTAMLVHNNNITEPDDDAMIDNTARSLIFDHAGKVDGRISWPVELLGLGFQPQPIFSIGVMRARQDNLATYYFVRKYLYDGEYPDLYDAPGCVSYGFNNDSIECFAPITNNTILAEQLKNLYGSVRNIDAEIGMGLEQHDDEEYMPHTMSYVISQGLKGVLARRDIIPKDCFSSFPQSIMDEFNSIKSYADIVKRNIKGMDDIPDGYDSFTVLTPIDPTTLTTGGTETQTETVSETDTAGSQESESTGESNTQDYSVILIVHTLVLIFVALGL